MEELLQDPASQMSKVQFVGVGDSLNLFWMEKPLKDSH